MNLPSFHTAEPESRRLLVAAEDDTGTLIKILNLLLQHGHVLHALDMRISGGCFRIAMDVGPSPSLAVEITAEKLRSLVGVADVSLGRRSTAAADRGKRPPPSGE